MESSRPHERVIIVAGMYRSASAYVYNCACVLFQHAGQEVWGGTRSEFFQTEGDEADVYVVKTYKYWDLLAQYSDDILTSKRPIKQAWDSFRRFRLGMGDEKDDLPPWQVTQEWAEWLREWRRERKCRYMMKWTDYVEDEGAWVALKDIAHVLDIDVNLVHVMRHLRSTLAPPANKDRDPRTLIFRNHYTSFDYEDDIKPRLTVPSYAK